MVTLYKPTAAFVKAMKKAGQNPMLMTLSPVGTEQLVQELGPEARGIGISAGRPLPVERRHCQWSVNTKSSPQQTGELFYYGMEGYLMAAYLGRRIQARWPRPESRKTHFALESINNVDFGGFRINYSAHYPPRLAFCRADRGRAGRQNCSSDCVYRGQLVKKALFKGRFSSLCTRSGSSPGASLRTVVKHDTRSLEFVANTIRLSEVFSPFLAAARSAINLFNGRSSNPAPAAAPPCR
jgi:hypothetical protein